LETFKEKHLLDIVVIGGSTPGENKSKSNTTKKYKNSLAHKTSFKGIKSNR
jgi:hypothetical protein